MYSFIHLHNHSEFSLLDGLATTKGLAQKAKDLGMDAIALTDHGAMYGIHEFYVNCKKVGIKPILGVELYMARASRFDRDPEKDKVRYHIVLLAKNNEGYKNLMKLVTIANLEGFYYKPRIDWESLIAHKDGLIVTSACLNGEVARNILTDNPDKAKDIARHYHEAFGEDYYLEIQRHPGSGDEDFEKVNQGIIKIARDLGIGLVATNDIHYVNKDDAEAQDALVAVGIKKLVTDSDRMSMLGSPSYYMRSPAEMQELFSDLPDALENTVKIADKCTVELELGGRIMPHFPIPKGMTEGEYLKELTYKKAKSRFPDKFETFKERLDYELGIIIDKGFAAYFLIYEDFVNWSKDHSIRVGPGRGSAAGSLVSYVLNITTLDPIEHGLPFERFLNPARPTPPDIDMDFADDRRDDTINYVRHKYGEDKVAQIITFGRMEARAAIRDIGRVLGLPYSEPDKLAKMIPVGLGIKETLETVKEFKAEYDNDERYKKLIDLARKVEGNVRHASIHAAALVVAPDAFVEFAPLQKDEKNNKVVTQYDMRALDCNVSDDAIGLLKMDFLGLRNLSILQKAIDLVKTQRNIVLDIDNLPLDDKKVYELISNGDTTGVFQMESGGMRRVAKNLKPSKFSDISALVALYRPGPMDLIDDFIKGKESPESVHYPHEDLKPVLGETYGIAVYQEQCLQIANVMAGYSLGEADILRRAIGKKKIEIMMKEKQKFFEGTKKKGYTEKIADTVWGYIEKFAGYGFNKAHSASYAMIAYQTAWMKVHYPVEFMTAVLTAESGNADKFPIFIEECKRLKIDILPPDINKSDVNFTIEAKASSLEGKAIRFGLSAIKNVGEAAIEAITSVRKTGEFENLMDFFSRVDNQKVNKRVIESLIQVGAFDRYGNRAALLSGFEIVRQKALGNIARKASGQVSFFDTFEPEEKSTSGKDELPEVEEIDSKQRLTWEKQLLGFYLTDNPITRQMSLVKDLITYHLGELDPDLHIGQNVVLGGAISSMRKVFTKKSNSEMAFATLADESGQVDMVIFPKVFEECKALLGEDRVVLCHGKLDFREDELSFVANKIIEVDEKIHDYVAEYQTVTIPIPRGTDKDILVNLSNLLKSNPGGDTCVLEIPNGGTIPKKITLPYKIKYNRALQKQIDYLLR